MKYFGDWLIMMAYVALVFVLVRPGSQGPGFVGALGKSAASVVTASTGGGKW